jgi:hypothetical protein
VSTVEFNVVAFGVNPGNSAGCILFDTAHRIKTGNGAIYFGSSTGQFAISTALSHGPFRTLAVTYMSDGTLTAYDHTGASIKTWTGLSIPDVASPYVALTNDAVRIQGFVTYNRVLTSSEIAYLYDNMEANNSEIPTQALSLSMQTISSAISTLSYADTQLSAAISSHLYTGEQRVLNFTTSMSSTAISNTLFTDNSNMYFRTALHNTLVPNYVYFHNTNADRTISTNVPTSAYSSIFATNPILSANQTYCIDFCVTMLSFSTANNVNTFLRISGTGVISSLQAVYATCATDPHLGAIVHNTAHTAVAISTAPVTLHEGANNQPNRYIQGHVVLRMGSTGGSVIFEIAADAVGSPVLIANTGMRVQWLGPVGSDLTFGTSV